MAMSVFFVIFMALIYLIFVGGMLVFVGLGLWRMAKNAGIPHAWVAFLYPTYILALLAQRSMYTFTGKQRELAKWSIWGLIAGLGVLVLTIIGGTLAVVFGSQSSATTIIGAAALAIPLSLCISILHYYCMYYVLKDYCPGNEVLFLILSIVFSIASPILFIVQMNTVPVSVAGRTPYQQPKYNRV